MNYTESLQASSGDNLAFQNSHITFFVQKISKKLKMILSILVYIVLAWWILKLLVLDFQLLKNQILYTAYFLWL